MVVMGDLLREFLTETGEHLDTVDRELVRFERNAGDQAILRNIFRLVHTIKGTCGFLGLPRLAALAHAAETLMGRLRDGMPVTSEAVTAVLGAVDRIKLMLVEIGRLEAEPEGSDDDLIALLERAAAGDQAGIVAPAPGAALPDADLPDAGLPTFPDRTALDATSPMRDPTERGAGTIRIAISTIEHLMTMVSELVQTRNQLLEVSRRLPGSEAFMAPLQRLSQVTAGLQDSVVRARMQPIESAWSKLPRLLRDLSGELGKSIELVLQGGDTELDRQLLDLIRDPLTHMVRNAADHGIETPAERLAVGKPARGTIRLGARQAGGTITIELGDDGRGLDHRAIARRALATGLVSEADLAGMSEGRIAEFILHPGFSTRESAGAVSGRGVGMDVVKTNLDAIGGTMAIVSELGRGTTFTLQIPLTLAIVAALLVELDGHRFALPQAAVLEIVRVGEGGSHRLERIGAAPVLRLRGKILPVLHAGALLGMADRTTAGEPAFVVAMQVGRRGFGLLVDNVLETQEIVVKPMCARLRGIPVFSGNTILGDGAVVLILDPNGVARRIGPEIAGNAWGGEHDPIDGLDRPAARRVALLVVRASGLKAIPLARVTRLEHVDAQAIEHLGAEPWIQIKGRLTPVLVLPGTTLPREGALSLVVMSEFGRSVALAVEEIVDIVDEAIEIEAASGRPGFLGSCVLGGRATEIVDLMPLLGDSGRHGRRRAGEPPGAPAHEPDPVVRTVLLVDDGAFFRDMLGPVLRAAGYRVRLAADAESAMAAIAAHRVEALVTDLEMPGRSGLELIGDLRNHPGLAHLPVIALASCAAPEVVERARALGVLAVVAKFDRSGLLAALARADRAMGWAA